MKVSHKLQKLQVIALLIGIILGQVAMAQDPSAKIMRSGSSHPAGMESKFLNPQPEVPSKTKKGDRKKMQKSKPIRSK